MAKAIVNRQESTIDINTLDNCVNFQISYDKELDTLYWSDKPVQPATSVDWNGELWFRVIPENGRITAIEIEDYERVFLKKHPDLAPPWNQVKKKVANNKGDASVSTFGSILFSFIKNWLKQHPKQAEMGAVVYASGEISDTPAYFVQSSRSPKKERV